VTGDRGRRTGEPLFSVPCPPGYFATVTLMERNPVWGTRSVEAGQYLEGFLAAAVAAVLVIRVFLMLTGYPQVGGRGLHIAHLLWGGLFMTVAIVLLLAVLGETAKRGAAILGGVGFGAFIDELGKFITSDNNYFFQPAIALIYVIFVLMFLAVRYLEPHRGLSPRDKIVNAVDRLENALLGGAARKDLLYALYLLNHCGATGPEIEAIRQALHAVSEEVRDAPTPVPRSVALTRRGFDLLGDWKWFQRGVIAVFVAHATVVILVTLVAVAVVAPAQVLAGGSRSVAAFGSLGAAAIATLLTFVGVSRLPTSRLAAYHWFKRAVLVSILLVQVFLFYESQLAALGGLAVDVIVLAGLNELIDRERGAQRARAVSAAQPVRNLSATGKQP
jgi:hypothetical protein